MRKFRRVADWIASHQLLFLAVAGPFLLFPFGPWPILALGLVAMTWLCRWIAYGRPSISTGLDAPILIILVMAMVGYTISVDRALSQTRLWSLILGIAVFYGIVNSVKPDRQVGVVSGFLALLTLGIAGISLVGTDWQQTRLIDVPWIYDRLPTLIRGLPNSGVPRPSDLIHPRFVGITMGVMVAVFLAQLFYSRNRILRLLSLLVVVVGFGTLLLTQTLAGLAGLLLAVLFLLIWRNRWFLLIIPVSLLGAIIGMLVIGPTQVLEYLLSSNNPIGIAVNLRLDIWSRALAMIQDMPYTGIGLNTFPNILSSFYPGFLLGPEPHAHNLLIQTVLDLGLPGLAAFLWLLIGWIYLIWRKYRANDNREYRILLLGMLAGILAYVTHGFMDAMMLGAKPSVVMWILMGIGAAPASVPDEVEDPVLKKTPGSVKSILSLSLFSVIVLAVALLNPASVYLNLGTIQAHQALSDFQASGSPDLPAMERAKVNLIEASTLHEGYLNAYELLGRIYAREGNAELALNAFAQRVSIDGKDPLLHYFPSDLWLRQIHNVSNNEGSNWQDLNQVYQHWMIRYPDRAEVYSELGIVWQCYLNNPEMAANLIRTGIEKQAVPGSMLEYHLDFLGRANMTFCLQNK